MWKLSAGGSIFDSDRVLSPAETLGPLLLLSSWQPDPPPDILLSRLMLSSEPDPTSNTRNRPIICACFSTIAIFEGPRT